jgi:hypothetical protein
MREDPGLDVEKISACLEAHYGLRVTSVTFLPLPFALIHPSAWNRNSAKLGFIHSHTPPVCRRPIASVFPS